MSTDDQSPSSERPTAERASRNAVVTYDVGWEANSVSWSCAPDPQRLAVSSFIPDGPNHISILEKNPSADRLEKVGGIKYFYPPTKVQFAPRAAIAGRDADRDLLAASSDFLRLWDIHESSGPAVTGGSNMIGGTGENKSANDDGSGPNQRTATPLSGGGGAGLTNTDSELSMSSGTGSGVVGGVVGVSPTATAAAAGVVATASSTSFRKLLVDQWRLFKRTRPPSQGGSGSSSNQQSSSSAPGSSSSQPPGARGSSSAPPAAPPPGTTHSHHPATSADDFCDPVTSFDWCRDKVSMIAETSTDTTISVWDIVAEVLTIQLIAHDRPVFDCSFAPGESVFASCGADGSVRVFDLRSMENCTIVYEESPRDPILRVAWSPKAPYIAATVAESPRVVIIDMRQPTTPVCSQAMHEAPISSLCWHHTFSQTLCCVGEDGRALIWDINSDPQSPPTPQMTYDAGAPINGVSWNSVHDEWVAIAFGNKVSALLV